MHIPYRISASSSVTPLQLIKAAILQPKTIYYEVLTPLIWNFSIMINTEIDTSNFSLYPQKISLHSTAAKQIHYNYIKDCPSTSAWWLDCKRFLHLSINEKLFIIKLLNMSHISWPFYRLLKSMEYEMYLDALLWTLPPSQFLHCEHSLCRSQRRCQCCLHIAQDCPKKNEEYLRINDHYTINNGTLQLY
jgi:hypothetical protein